MRKYKRKRPRRWRDTNKRMVAAVRCRTRGLSLRQTAGRLAVSYETIRRDLARWDRDHANVVELVPESVTNACHISPPGGQIATPECDSDSAVIEFRRKA